MAQTHIDPDVVQILIDDAVRLGPDALAARVCDLESADEAARASGLPVSVTLEVPDPLTGQARTVQAPTMSDALRLAQGSADDDSPAQASSRP